MTTVISILSLFFIVFTLLHLFSKKEDRFLNKRDLFAKQTVEFEIEMISNGVIYDDYMGFLSTND